MKRLFDIVASGIGLILLSPLFLVLAIWIKLDSKGPVFYRQVRVGKIFVFSSSAQCEWALIRDHL